MDSAELRAVQQPLKDAYRKSPEEAVVTLRAHGELDEQAISCSVATGQALSVAGLHPATGGDGSLACSGDMLLQALVACAGVTLRAVATSLQIELAGGTVTAEGDLDFRGTLAVSKDAPVGFSAIRLAFDLNTDASAEQVQTLIRLTERYCVVYQTLAHPAQLSVSANGLRRGNGGSSSRRAGHVALALADRRPGGSDTGGGRYGDDRSGVLTLPPRHFPSPWVPRQLTRLPEEGREGVPAKKPIFLVR
jgi:uncharacterized OsmC-like protein